MKHIQRIFFFFASIAIFLLLFSNDSFLWKTSKTTNTLENFLINRDENSWSYHTEWNENNNDIFSLDQFKVLVSYESSSDENHKEAFYTFTGASVDNATNLQSLVDNGFLEAKLEPISTQFGNRQQTNLIISGTNNFLTTNADFTKTFNFALIYKNGDMNSYSIPPLNLINPEMKVNVTSTGKDEHFNVNFIYDLNFNNNENLNNLKIDKISLKNEITNEEVLNFSSFQTKGEGTFITNLFVPQIWDFFVVISPKVNNNSDKWVYNFSFETVTKLTKRIVNNSMELSFIDSSNLITGAKLKNKISDDTFLKVNQEENIWKIIIPLEKFKEMNTQETTLIVEGKNFVFDIDLSILKINFVTPTIKSFDAKLINGKVKLSWEFLNPLGVVLQANILKGKKGESLNVYHHIDLSETTGTWEDSELNIGDTYSYQLKLYYVDVSTIINSVSSKEVSITINNIEPTFTSFSVDLLTSKIAINWEINDDANVIETISLKRNGLVIKEIAKEETTGSYEDKDLDKNKTYNYQIVIDYHNFYDDITYNTSSEVVSISTEEVAPIINSFNATFDNYNTVVNWDITDEKSSIISLKILRNGEEIHNVEDTTALVDSWTDNDLRMNTSYHYQLSITYLSGYDGTEVTINSSFEEITTDDVAPLINSFDATLIDNKAKITWNINDDNNTITSIELLKDNNVLKDIDATDLDNNIEDTELQTNQTYNYQLKITYNDLYDSSGSTLLILNSEIKNISTENITPTINTFNASLNDKTILINWDIKDDSTAITSISLLRNGDEIKTIAKEDLANSYNDNDLESNKTYNYSLIVNYQDPYNPSGTSLQLYSSGVTVTTEGIIPIINSFNATLDDFKTTITWDVSDDKNIITSGTILRDGELIKDVDGLSGTFEDTNLTMDKSYNYQLVINYNDYYNETKTFILSSDIIQVVTSNITPIINNFDVSLKNEEAEITWDISDDASTIDSIIFYKNEIKIHEINNPKTKDLISSWSDPELTMNKSYSYKMMINYNDFYEGTKLSLISDIKTVKTLDLIPSIFSFNAEIINYQGEITWNILDNASSITEVAIYRNNEKIFTTKEIIGSYKDSELKMNEFYSYQLIISYDDFYSTSTLNINSNIETIKTNDLIPIINGFNANLIDNNTIKITWNIDDKVDDIKEIWILKNGTKFHKVNKSDLSGELNDTEIDVSSEETIEYQLEITYDNFYESIEMKKTMKVTIDLIPPSPQINSTLMYSIIAFLVLLIIIIIIWFSSLAKSFKSRI